jgi:hypothetical protein
MAIGAWFIMEFIYILLTCKYYIVSLGILQLPPLSSVLSTCTLHGIFVFGQIFGGVSFLQRHISVSVCDYRRKYCLLNVRRIFC